jgi:uncharacterized protein involved in tolerance to divalent cations
MHFRLKIIKVNYSSILNKPTNNTTKQRLFACVNCNTSNDVSNWLIKLTSKYESVNVEVKKTKQQLKEQVLGRENTHDYIRKNGGRIHYIDDDY